MCWVFLWVGFEEWLDEDKNGGVLRGNPLWKLLGMCKGKMKLPNVA